MRSLGMTLRRPGRLAMASLFALACFGPETTVAQTNQPQVSHVFPAGGQRGTTFKVGVRGRHLEGATEVRVSGAGVQGRVLSVEQPDAEKKKNEKRLDVSENPDVAQVEITVTADAEVGERDFRLVAPGGVSNRYRFYVDEIPEVTEVEPNSLPEDAQTLESTPIVVNGQTFQADRDIFRFRAKAGQTLVLDAYAQRILPYIADAVPGWFQASLTLYDSSGKEVDFVDDFRHHPDPVLIHEVQSDGEYLVEIRDVLYRGRDDFVYRLRIGALPFITHVFPLGFPRGSQAKVQLSGVNLQTDATTLELSVDDPPRRWVRVSADGLTSNALPFAVDDLPQTFESEPNDSRDTAMRLELPVTIDGRIGSEEDVDTFAFRAEAQQTLVMEVVARRLDSPLDSVLVLLDSKGRQLAQNDDSKDESEGLVVHHADSYVLHTVAAAGEYFLLLQDVQGRGGDEYAYRLRMTPPTPDFSLRVRPDNPRAAQGSSALLTVTAFRRDGFEGPIKLSARGLPEGFVFPDAQIPEKQSETRFTITGSPEVALGVLSPTVAGTAMIGDREVVREATPSEELMQAFYYTHNVPSKEFLLAVVESGPFTLSLQLPPGGLLKIPRRGAVEVPVKATFKDGFKGAIALKPDAPPKGFRVQAPPIPAGKTETTITVTTVGQQVTVGQTGALILTGTLRSGKNSISGFVPAIPFEIVR